MNYDYIDGEWQLKVTKAESGKLGDAAEILAQMAKLCPEKYGHLAELGEAVKIAAGELTPIRNREKPDTAPAADVTIPDVAAPDA